MPKIRKKRVLTGNNRKERNYAIQYEYRHERGLSVEMVDVRTRVQRMWARCNLVLNDTSTMIATLLLLQDTFVNPDILLTLLTLSYYSSCYPILLTTVVRPLDFYLFDVDPNEEGTHYYGPPINRTIESLSDDKAIMLTRFSKTDLIRIYACFNMPQTVRISNGLNCSYLMTGEEIFIFSLAKLAHGTTFIELCATIFGGSPKRWQFAYKYFLGFVLARYGSLLSFEGLRREEPNFPQYARKIARRINRPILKFDLATNTYHEILNAITVDENFFRIAFFVDGSYFKCDTPGTGQHGHYKGAPRKPWAYITQIQKISWNRYTNYYDA